MQKFALDPTQRQAKVPSEPKQITAYLVRTIFGPAVLFSSSWVYVKLGNEYIRKPVSELSKGEEVLFAKEGLKGLTLAQVNDALLKSDRYAATYPVLFREVNGFRMPAFTHAILDAILTVPVWGPIRGTRPVLGPNRMIALDEHQLVDAASFIHDRLEEASIAPVHTNHIRYGWLSGQVIAPRNRAEVCTALLPFAPGLSALLSEDFGNAYRLYMAIRRSAIATLSTELKMNLHPTQTKHGERSSDLSVRPELRLLLEHFASNVSEAHGAGRVLEVRPLPKHEVPHEGRENGIFFKGVVTSKAEDTTLKIKTPKNVMLESSALSPIINRIAYEFLIHEISRTISRDATGFGERQVNLHDLMNGLHAAMGFGGDKTEAIYERCHNRLRAAGGQRLDEFLPKDSERSDPQEKKTLCEKFVQALSSGELDALYRLPVGTLLAACDYYCKLQSAIPEDAHYYQTLQILIQAKDRKAKETRQAVSKKVEERELADTYRRLTRLWGDVGIGPVMNTAAYLCTHHDTVGLEIFHNVFAGHITPAEAIRQAALDIPITDDIHALSVLSNLFPPALQRLYPRANLKIRRPTYQSN